MRKIEFKNVVKEYKLYKNDKQRLAALFSKKINPKVKLAIDDLSFVIEANEAVAFIGRNGAGKSTILKMITKVSYPTKGEISVTGKIGALLELSAGFDSEFSGRENIYLKASLLGMKKHEIKEKEQEIIKYSEIDEEYIDQPIRSYSSGMKARLGFALVVCTNPDIIIIDEALSVGDSKFKKKCEKTIKEMIENGATVLFVTHSLRSAMKFCTRGIVIDRGKIYFDGEINEAIEFYNNMHSGKKR